MLNIKCWLISGADVLLKAPACFMYHSSLPHIGHFCSQCSDKDTGMVFVQALRQELSLWCLLTAIYSLALLSKAWECKRGWQDSDTEQGHLELTFHCWEGCSSSLNSDEFTPPRVGGHGKDKICLLTFSSRIKVMLCAWKYTEAVNSWKAFCVYSQGGKICFCMCCVEPTTWWYFRFKCSDLWGMWRW